MFYAHFVLAKKGPLARIWLAAHWDKKLTKAHVFETNIEKSVDGILQPKVKMALRTSGHLLLGVVRIYSRKAKYLLADCNEAFIKIKMAFRPGMVDLPEDNREAAVNAITLPEVFHDFDTAMPELNDVDIEAQFSLNQSRAEEITMREDYGNISNLVSHEEGFGDMEFDTDAPELLRASTLEPSLDQANLLFSDDVDLDKDKEPLPSTSAGSLLNHRAALEIDAPIQDDGFGGNLGQDMIGGLFEGGLFDDAPMPEVPAVDTSSVAQLDMPQEQPAHAADSDDDDHFDHAMPSPGAPSSDGSRPASPLDTNNMMPPPLPPQAPTQEAPPLFPEPQEPEPAADHTTLLQNEEESFALAPVDASALKGLTKTKRKRKLIVDEIKNISGEEMKAQLSDTSDIVTTLDLAPPTKRLMHWKETGGVEKLFALPGRPIPARVLFKNYQRHLTSRAAPNEDYNGADNAADQMPLDLMNDGKPEAEVEKPEPATRGRGRKRKQPAEPVVEELPPPPTPVIPPPTPEPAQMQMPPSVGVPEPIQDTTLPPIPEEIEAPMSVPPMSVPPATPAPTPGMPLMEEQAPAPSPAPYPPMSELIPEIPEQALPSEQEAPLMENMGYEDSALHPMMANMGYDETHPPATTPGAISERGQNTPWHEDYELPVSVGPADEQAVDETIEQFEERVLNKRASQLYHLIKTKYDQGVDKLCLSDLTHRNNRKQAAQKFYSLLVLKKFQVLELTQSESYAEIGITRGSNFLNPVL
nr:PREDICTED: double-strand-break repair protein rad21 homolog isoform X2 [Bemisia tabaci]